MHGFLKRRRSHSLLWGTMLLMVLARGFIPAGLMLGQDGAGGLTLTPCPGIAYAAVQGGNAGNGHHPPGADAARWGGSCLFAVSAPAAPPPHTFAPDALFIRLIGVVAAPQPASAAIPSILRAQSPRAPPVPAWKPASG